MKGRKLPGNVRNKNQDDFYLFVLLESVFKIKGKKIISTGLPLLSAEQMHFVVFYFLNIYVTLHK